MTTVENFGDWRDQLQVLQRGAVAPAPAPAEPAVAPPKSRRKQAARASDADLTEAGDAARFAKLCGVVVRYVPAWDLWLVWDGTHWVRDHQNVLVSELAKGVGRSWFDDAGDAISETLCKEMSKRGKESLRARGIRALLELARGIPGIAVDHNDLDADPWLFGVANGVIDLRTAKLLPPDPARLMTMQSSVAYDIEAPCPRWEQALSEWFPNADVRDYIQRLVGAALVGVQRDHVFVIHFGGGRNGKGSFTRAIALPFGPYFIAPHLSLIVESKHQEHDTVKADLFRVRLAVASETERRVRLAESSVKNLTGGDAIRCRRLYENPWEFTPSHHLWLQTNYLPHVRGRDRGIWSRLKVVPWENTFEGRADRTLDETLKQEAAGILAWAVAGCLAWQQRGLVEPEAVQKATLAYRAAEDIFGRFATENGLAFQKERRINAAWLNRMVDEWATSESIKFTRSDFREWLETNGATKARSSPDIDGKRPEIWIGFGGPQ